MTALERIRQDTGSSNQPRYTIEARRDSGEQWQLIDHSHSHIKAVISATIYTRPSDDVRIFDREMDAFEYM